MVFLVAAALFSLITANAAGAQTAPVWQPIGPFGGVVNGLAVDPSRALTVYAATATGGMFRSFNAGRSWTAIGQGLDGRQLAAVAVGADGTVVAGSPFGIWRSVDGGASWQEGAAAPGSGSLSARQLAFDPNDPHTIYAAGSLVAGALKSSDDGATWEALGVPAKNATTLAVVGLPGRPGVVLAATDNGIHRSTDGGVSFRQVSAACAPAVLLVDPVRTARIYAGCTHDPNVGEDPNPLNEILVSLDAGLTWRPANTGLHALVGAHTLGVQALASLPGAPNTVYAGTGDGIYRTTDAAAHWVRLDQGAFAAVAALAILPTQPAAVLAGAGEPVAGFAPPPLGGVYRSPDLGADWYVSNRGLTALPVRALAIDLSGPGHLFLGTSGYGPWRTRDDGAAWHPLTGGFPDDPFFGALTLSATPPSSPATLYASASDSSGKRSLASSQDAGNHWALVTPPFEKALPAEVAGVHAVDPLDPSHVLAGDVDGVWESHDGGATWQLRHLADGAYIQAIAFAPSSPATVYAGGNGFLAPYAGSGGTYKSIDGGITWTKLAAPGLSAFSLAVDPTDPETVFAVLDSSGVQRSVDGGATWTSAGLDRRQVAALLFDANLPGYVIAGLGPEGPEPGDGAVWISADHGATWNPLGAGLPAAAGVTALGLGPAPAHTLYAATGSGVWELAGALPQEP